MLDTTPLSLLDTDNIPVHTFRPRYREILWLWREQLTMKVTNSQNNAPRDGPGLHRPSAVDGRTSSHTCKHTRSRHSHASPSHDTRHVFCGCDSELNHARQSLHLVVNPRASGLHRHSPPICMTVLENMGQNYAKGSSRAARAHGNLTATCSGPAIAVHSRDRRAPARDYNHLLQ